MTKKKENDYKSRAGDIRERKWTYSAVSAYLRCPKYFELTYIDGVRASLSSDLVEGISHHHALDEDNITKYKKGKPTTAKKHYECFADNFSTEKKNIKVWGDKENTIINRGKLIINSYKVNDISNVVPAKINNKPANEYFFKFPIEVGRETYFIQGFIDLVSLPKKSFNLYDYKVTKAAKSQTFVNGSLQLSIYTIAIMKNTLTKASNVNAGIISMVKNSMIDVKTGHRNMKQLAWSMGVVKEVIKAAEKGIFPMCNPENYLCSDKYCGHWKRCRGK